MNPPLKLTMVGAIPRAARSVGEIVGGAVSVDMVLDIMQVVSTVVLMHCLECRQKGSVGLQCRGATG